MGLFGMKQGIMKSHRLNLFLFAVRGLCLAGLGFYLVVVGCDSKGTKSRVSSATFFAPVPVKERAVELLVDKNDLLRVINDDKLESQLEDEDARAVVLGKIAESRELDLSYTLRTLRGAPIRQLAAYVESTVYVIFERNSGSLFEFELIKVFERGTNTEVDEQITLTLSIKGTDLGPALNTTVAKFSAVSLVEFNGSLPEDRDAFPNFESDSWIYGFESSERSLFVLRRVMSGGAPTLNVTRLANINSIRRQLRKQSINFIESSVLGARVTQDVDGKDIRLAEILLKASRPGGAGGLEGIQDLHLFLVEEKEGVVTGGFRVFSSSGARCRTEVQDGAKDPVFPNGASTPICDAVRGLVSFDEIRSVTGIVDIDIFDFKPVVLRDPDFPGESLVTGKFFLLFEENSSTFLVVELVREGNPTLPDVGEIIGSHLRRFSGSSATTNEVQTAIGDASASATSIQFKAAFYHPEDAVLLTFEEGSDTMLQLDYTGYDEDISIGDENYYDSSFGQRIKTFATKNSLLERRDHQSIPGDADFSPEEPTLVVSDTDVSENRLFFDQGSDDILSLNYSTGIYVVVIKQKDISDVTRNIGVSDLTFMSPINNNEILIMDSQAGDLLRVRLDYAAFPVRIRGDK